MTFQNWETQFTDVFSKLDDKWDFQMVNAELPDDGWLQTKYIGLVNFTCNSAQCNHSVSSAVSTAIFYYRRHSASGNVVKLFVGRQICRKCDSESEVAQWDEREIQEALTKVLNNVKEQYYRSENPPTTISKSYLAVRVSFGVHLKISKILPYCEKEIKNKRLQWS